MDPARRERRFSTEAMGCPTPGKRFYAGEAEAAQAVPELGRAPGRVYRCACGFWHMSRPKRRHRNSVRRRALRAAHGRGEPIPPTVPDPGIAESGGEPPPLDRGWLEGSWVRRGSGARPHECAQPEHGGMEGDLWRCGSCGRLWRVVGACSACESDDPCMVGLTWAEASWWQRWRNRRRP
jgi:hypothetical protein